MKTINLTIVQAEKIEDSSSASIGSFILEDQYNAISVNLFENGEMEAVKADGSTEKLLVLTWGGVSFKVLEEMAKSL